MGTKTCVGFFYEAHLDEALPSEDVCGAAIVDEDPTNVVSREMYKIYANVCMNNKGVILWVML